MSEYNVVIQWSDQTNLMILLELDVWIFNSVFYGCESGSQIGSWRPDSSKLLLMFSGKLSMSKILFVGSVRSSIRYNVTLWVKEKARLWVFTQPNVTVSQQSLKIAAKLSVRSSQGNLTNPRPKTFLFCHIFLSLWSSILRMSSIFLLLQRLVIYQNLLHQRYFFISCEHGQSHLIVTHHHCMIVIHFVMMWSLSPFLSLQMSIPNWILKDGLIGVIAHILTDIEKRSAQICQRHLSKSKIYWALQR